jgi:ferredoxin-NADP reductase
MHKYIVKSADQITDTTLLLNLEQKSGKRQFIYQPGQYAAISFYNRGRPTPARCFSIVSSPTDRGKLQFSMRTKGHFTKTMAHLKPGDLVKVRGPYGGFVLDIATSNDVVFLAGGIGITPFMSMVSYTANIQASTKITLFYSCQTQDDVPFLDKLRGFEQQNPNLRVTFVVGNGVTDKLAGLSVVSGHLTPEVIDTILNRSYDNRTFYVCGPPPYMDAMARTLRLKGVSEGDIITEAFVQASSQAAQSGVTTSALPPIPNPLMIKNHLLI